MVECNCNCRKLENKVALITEGYSCIDRAVAYDFVKEYGNRNILNNFIRYAKKEIKITVKNNKLTLFNDGPNIDKETIIPDMKNWDVDKVIKFVEENYLTNLTIDFEFSNQIEKDLQGRDRFLFIETK